jgi:hypothetical protein
LKKYEDRFLTDRSRDGGRYLELRNKHELARQERLAANRKR